MADGDQDDLDCRWCEAKPGDVCPVFGEPAKILWGEYYDSDKTRAKGRWCSLCKRTSFSYGATATKKHILKQKSEEAFCAGYQRRRDRLIEKGKKW